MASSGRSAPPAREKGAQVHAGQDTEDTSRREPAPAATNPLTSIEHDHNPAAPPPHSSSTANANANANDDTTAAVPKENGPHTSSSGQRPSAHRSWRSVPGVQRFANWLLRGKEQVVNNGEEVVPNVETAPEDFRRWIRISYKVGNNDEPQDTLALFDTQCPEDWISVSFVRDTWGTDFSGQPKSCVAGTLNGVAVQSFGRINLAWSSRDNRCNWLPGKLSFKPKTYRATFEVIDTEDFDVIIGQKSIARHKLLILNNRLFGLFKAHRPAIRPVTQMEAAESQARADARRADARRADAERRRSQANAQSAPASNTASTTTTNGQ